VITQVSLTIPSLHIERISFMIRNDLCYVHLPATSKLICYLRLSLTMVWAKDKAIAFSHKIVFSILGYWPFKHPIHRISFLVLVIFIFSIPLICMHHMLAQMKPYEATTFLDFQLFIFSLSFMRSIFYLLSRPS